MGATVHRAKNPIPTSFPALKTLFMMILIHREKVFTIKFLCLGHNWGYLGAPLCAYIFALGWCVTIGMPIQPGNASIRSNLQYFKSKLTKLSKKIFYFEHIFFVDVL